MTVNGQSTYRRGEFYRKELDLSGNNGAIWQGVTNSVAGGSTQTGALFLPASTENSTYDLDGNLTCDGRWTTILWDAENRLIELRRDTAPDSARLKVTFSYDWMRRRVRKTTYTWNGSGWTQASDSKFLYDGWNVTAELDGTTGYRKRTFMWGIDLSGSEHGAGGVGGLIKVSDVTGTQIDRFAVYDGTGNVTGLTSAVDGSLTARYEYGPFGEIERASGPDARSNCIRFSSKWQDDESGYFYYGYRYYDSGIGRWISRDPIEEAGGVNSYSYTSNNSTRSSDFMGLITIGFCGFEVWGASKSSGNKYLDSINDLLPDPVPLFESASVSAAFKHLLKKLDNTLDGQYDTDDVRQTIKIYGWSWGGVSSVQLANMIRNSGKFCIKDVNVVATVDPVSKFRSKPAVPSNVVRFVNWYQTKGPALSFKLKLNGEKFALEKGVDDPQQKDLNPTGNAKTSRYDPSGRPVDIDHITILWEVADELYR